VRITRCFIKLLSHIDSRVIVINPVAPAHSICCNIYNSDLQTEFCPTLLHRAGSYTKRLRCTMYARVNVINPVAQSRNAPAHSICCKRCSSDSTTENVPYFTNTQNKKLHLTFLWCLINGNLLTQKLLIKCWWNGSGFRLIQFWDFHSTLARENEDKNLLPH